MPSKTAFLYVFVIIYQRGINKICKVCRWPIFSSSMYIPTYLWWAPDYYLFYETVPNLKLILWKSFDDFELGFHVGTVAIFKVMYPKGSWNLIWNNIYSTQCVERISNKIAKPLNETCTGLKCMLQGFRICFVWNPRLKGIESTC